MFVAAQRRFAAGLFLVASTFIGGAAMGGVSATQPAVNDLLYPSTLNLPDDSHFTLTQDIAEESNPLLVPPAPPPSVDPVKAPKSINDPLPPAFWSGLSMLGICAAFISVRKIRQELLR